MSVSVYLSSLSIDQLKKLHGDLIDAGIAFDCHGDYKAIFERGRKVSKGRQKKIYAALRKAKKENINSMINALVELLPNGVS